MSDSYCHEANKPVEPKLNRDSVGCRTMFRTDLCFCLCHFLLSLVNKLTSPFDDSLIASSPVNVMMLVARLSHTVPVDDGAKDVM
jgi:hypothetical protein